MDMDTDAIQIELADTEEERVVGWREQELVRAGYAERTARRLARRLDIDLHRAVDIVRQGCDPDLAARILL
jgi:hypothetical protein